MYDVVMYKLAITGVGLVDEDGPLHETGSLRPSVPLDIYLGIRRCGGGYVAGREHKTTMLIAHLPLQAYPRHACISKQENWAEHFPSRPDMHHVLLCPMSHSM